MKKFISSLMVLCMLQGYAVFAELGTVTPTTAVVDNTKYAKVPVASSEPDISGGIFPLDWTATGVTVEDKGTGRGDTAVLAVDSTTTTKEIWKGFSDSIMGGNKYLFTSEFYFSNNTHTRNLMTIMEYGDTPQDNIENYILRAGNNGYFQVSKDKFAASVIDIMPYSAGTWYKIDMLVDLDDETYEYYINGKVVMTKRKLPYSLVKKKINRIIPVKQFDGKNGDAWVAVDNIGLYDLKKSIDDIHDKYIKTMAFEEKFETYATAEPAVALNPLSGYVITGNVAKPVTVDAAHGTSAYLGALSGVNGNAAEFYKLQTITGKKFLLTGEYKFTSTNQRRLLLVATQNAAGSDPKVELISVNASGSSKFTHSNSPEIEIIPNINYNTTDWYKVDVFIDSEAATPYYEAYINGALAARGNLSAPINTINRVDLAKQWNGNTTDNGVYIDNIGVYTLLEKSSSVSNNDYVISTLKKEYAFETIKEEKFDGFTDVSEIDGSTRFGLGGTNPLSLAGLSDGYGYGKSLGVGVSSTIGASEFFYTLPATAGGKYVIKASYKFSSYFNRKLIFEIVSQSSGGQTLRSVVARNNVNNFALETNGATNLLQYTKDEWYDILGVYDTATQKYDLYINGRKVINQRKFSEDSTERELNTFWRIFFVKHWDPTGGDSITYIDNIGIYKLTPDAAPKVKITKYGDEVTKMNQLSDGDVIKATVDRAVDNNDILFFVQKNVDDIEKILVAGKNENMECVIKLPSNLTGVNFSGFLWSGFESLIPRTDKMELK